MEEVPAQRVPIGLTRVAAKQGLTKRFPRAKHFTASRPPPAVVARREIEQLERAVQRVIMPFNSTRCRGAQRAIDFAANVRHLLEQRS